MRWLAVHPGPNFSVADVYAGWVESLRALGQQVETYNLDDRLSFYISALVETGMHDEAGHPAVRQAMDRETAVSLAAERVFEACYRFWPEIVLVVSSFFLPSRLLEVMQNRGHKIVLLHTESPYQDEEQLERAQFASVNLLNDPVNIEKYRALGMPAEYMPHAYRPSLHHPGPADPRLACDLSFSGTGYPSRIEFFEQMDLKGIETILAGNWMPLSDESHLNAMLCTEKDECLDNDQTVELYRSSKAGINIYRQESEDQHAGEGWAIGPREVEMAATGLFYLRDSRGEGDELFKQLPVFHGPQDASQQLRWWLAHDDAREVAAQYAREAVADRTFDNNARRLLQILDRLK